MSERTLEDRVCETMCMVLSGRPIAGCAERERRGEAEKRKLLYEWGGASRQDGVQRVVE